MEVEKAKSSVNIKTEVWVYGTGLTNAAPRLHANMQIWKGASGAMYIDIGSVGFGDPAIRLQMAEVDGASKLWEYVLLGLLAD